MNDTRNARYSVTALVSDNEKSLFTSMARDLDVSSKILTRRLIRYLLDGKISGASRICVHGCNEGIEV